MQSFGLKVPDSSSEEESDGEEEGEQVSEPQIFPNTDDLKGILHRCNFNWFEFIEHLQLQGQDFTPVEFDQLFQSLSKYDFDDVELALLQQSYQAFSAAEVDGYDQDQIARAINGEVVSESESDTPEAYTNISDHLA